MKKNFLSLVFIICCGIIYAQKEKKQPTNFFDTSNYKMKDSYPNSFEKVIPGCIEVEKFIVLKTFLKQKCNIDIDSVGTVNIFYMMPKKSCDFDAYKKIKIDQQSNVYFKMLHSTNYTRVNNPVIFVQYELEKINNKWFFDENNLLHQIFLDYDKSLHCEAMITISKNRSYFLDWDNFNPTVFNSFCNELTKYKCE
jgi:hypothetical protein